MRLMIGLLLSVMLIGVPRVQANHMWVQGTHCYDRKPDWGEWVYLNHPDSILRAIYVIEGARPSYGVMYLAQKYGGHGRVPRHLGRRAAAKTVHNTFRRWKDTGGCGSFLAYLAYRYAPVGAGNDPEGLNRHWLANLSYNVAVQLMQNEARR